LTGGAGVGRRRCCGRLEGRSHRRLLLLPLLLLPLPPLPLLLLLLLLLLDLRLPTHMGVRGTS
jgi:hypothetical protein